MEKDRSMIARGARRKGAGFERRICKLLEEWTGYPFKRTPLSGGWAKEKVSGDVVCLDDDYKFPYSVELKNQEKWDLVQLLTPMNSRGKTKIIHWWEQCYNDAKIKNLMPLLIFTKNYYPILAMTYKDYILDQGWELPSNYFKFYYEPNLIIFNFEHFVKLNK